MLDMPHLHFSYEDLLPDPTPYVRAVADHAGVQDLPDYNTKLKVQSDTKSKEWQDRFVRDVKVKGFVDSTAPSVYPKKKLSNVIRWMKGAPLKPYPYIIL